MRRHLEGARGACDAVLLDVDNGPRPVAHASNAGLYGEAGVRSCYEALRPGGVLAVWSAGPDARYLERLRRAGFEAEVREVPARERRGVRHVVFLGSRR